MTKRTPSTQAQVAKAIRSDLKRLFPGVRFSVRSDSFAGGDSVDITWTDGPTEAQINAATVDYCYGRFDSSTDMYEYTNRRKDAPTVKYISTQWNHSAEREAEAEALTAARFDHERANVDQWYLRDYPYQLLQKQSLICSCGTNPLVGDVFCAECGQPLQDDERRAAQHHQQQAQEAGIDALLGALLSQ